MDEMGLKYNKNDEEMWVGLTGTGQDLPIQMAFRIYGERCLLVLLSKLPFTIPEDKRLDMVIAVSAINNRMAFGSFDFTVDRDSVIYRLSNCFTDCTPGSELFKWSIICAFRTVDEYNDKLQALVEGKQSVEQFLASLEA